MKTYLVGGAVRNELLGLAVTERDWVVVGSTEQAMLSDGYTQVGKDFPVFLHPKTKEEYALARTERKTGPGHQGFVCNADPSVTLEEDLARRDLTINAIAQDEAGARVDPYGGLKDIDAKILRHVSPAFIEDPLRVLRVARFLATLAHLGFKVAPETTDLLQSMVDEGMLTELAPERIFAEVTKAMKTSSPAVFFSYLASINANEVLWPEISSQAVARLERITSATDNLSPMADLRFISLAAGASETEISALCSRLKCSKQISELSLMLTKHLDTWQRLNGLDASTSSDSLSAAQIYEHLEKLDAFRRQDRFTLFGKIADLVTSSQAADIWQLALSSALTVSAKSIPEDIKGPAIGAAIKTARIAAIEAALAP